MRGISKKYLIFGVLLIAIASAGCTGEKSTATPSPEEVKDFEEAKEDIAEEIEATEKKAMPVLQKETVKKATIIDSGWEYEFWITNNGGFYTQSLTEEDGFFEPDLWFYEIFDYSKEGEKYVFSFGDKEKWTLEFKDSGRVIFTDTQDMSVEEGKWEVVSTGELDERKKEVFQSDVPSVTEFLSSYN